MTAVKKMRLAIIGAGPAGIYAADILQKAERDFPVSIDLFEHLPAPYGLVRYGVAPDHPRIKAIINALREVLDSGAVRLFANVHFGRDISLADLREHYHAVIFATGAISDAPLVIPGIDADGSFGAADFVSWFDGHPDVPRTWDLSAREVAVVGNGNVALDISRMLIKHAEDLLTTEIPDNVYAGLRDNPIQTLHVFGRRGPLQVKFTPLELRELGELRDVDMVLDPADFAHSDAYLDQLPASNKQVLVISRIFGQWLAAQAEREAGDAPQASRRIVFHFWSKPVGLDVDADGKVCGVRIQRTKPDGAGGVVDTDEFLTVPVQAVYRAVGYFGSELPDVPFDPVRGVIPNVQGRVVAQSLPVAVCADAPADAAAVPEHVRGLYATGWIKRGPVGLIGATKSDAKETLEALLADWQAGLVWDPPYADEQAVEALLADRDVEFTDVAGWQLLDAHEKALGAAAGRERIKVVPRAEMVRVSRGEQLAG